MDQIVSRTRRTLDVVTLLRQRMDEVVRDYDDSDPDSVKRIGEPIDGTGFFPGGHGVWRGLKPHGVLPTHFPEQPVMFVAHNFDKVAGFERSRKRGVESLGAATWKNLMAYLSFAQLSPEECFFTNALMGLQPSKALGKLKTTVLFREQCRMFLSEQIAIVRPRLVVALGKVAEADLSGISAAEGGLTLMHPYAANMDKAAPAAEGRRLGDAIRGDRFTRMARP